MERRGGRQKEKVSAARLLIIHTKISRLIIFYIIEAASASAAGGGKAGAAAANPHQSPGDAMKLDAAARGNMGTDRTGLGFVGGSRSASRGGDGELARGREGSRQALGGISASDDNRLGLICGASAAARAPLSSGFGRQRRR